MRQRAAPILVAVILAGGCGTSSPTLPPPPASALVPGQALWNLTATFTALSGPTTCFGRGNDVGTATNWILYSYRSGNDVILQYSDESLTGSSEGDTFRASQRWPGFFPCGGPGGARVDFDFEAAVAGRFSPDGNVITARETWTYRPSSGEPVVFTFDWVASRR